jgi:hypothetical protein
MGNKQMAISTTILEFLKITKHTNCLLPIAYCGLPIANFRHGSFTIVKAIYKG